MKWTVMAVVLLLAGCEQDAIGACGRACATTGKGMTKWSKTDGCVCGEPVKEPAK